MKIISVTAREILDSRGNPTVEADVITEDGTLGRAAVPSGASTGEGEAVELRDGDELRYNGNGTKKAVSNIKKIISPEIVGTEVTEQRKIDGIMLKADGTENKKHLGANAILAVSMAAADAAAKSLGLPLYAYLGGAMANVMPIPMMNVLNGGAHADNNVDIQEFMIMPVGADDMADAVRMGAEVFKALGNVIRGYGGITSVGDEGGYAPMTGSEEEALDLICEAIQRAGYTPGEDVVIALDAAASEWAKGEDYRLPKSGRQYTSEELAEYFYGLANKYPIFSIEDPLGENDWEGWQKMTARFSGLCRLVGDDLFVTNPKLIKKGISLGAADTVLIKVNQIGTLTEAFDAVETAKKAGYRTIISHRSGETEDTKIADIAVATGAGFIKTGAPSRCDRTAKYNRLMRIEEQLNGKSLYNIIKI